MGLRSGEIYPDPKSDVEAVVLKGSMRDRSGLAVIPLVVVRDVRIDESRSKPVEECQLTFSFASRWSVVRERLACLRTSAEGRKTFAADDDVSVVFAP